MVIVNVRLNVADVTKWMDRIPEILCWSSLKNSRGWICRNTPWEQN